jgi:hypothetical protein
MKNNTECRIQEIKKKKTATKALISHVQRTLHLSPDSEQTRPLFRFFRFDQVISYHQSRIFTLQHRQTSKEKQDANGLLTKNGRQPFFIRLSSSSIEESREKSNSKS